MARYRNTGAPIPREDGSMVETGEVFEPTPYELRTCHYKLEPAVGDDGPAGDDDEEAATDPDD